MSQRIRYQKTENPNEVISTRVYRVMDGKEVRVVLNLSKKSYEIVDATSGQVYEEAHSVTMHKVKMAAKTALTNLGANFDEEKRGKDEQESISTS